MLPSSLLTHAHHASTRIAHARTSPTSRTGSVDDYVTNLDGILGKKVECITDLRRKLNDFKKRLQEEEVLSSTFNKARAT